MPIEFRCTQCSKLLRTPDDTAGKRAQCPECGTVVAIPAATAAAGPPVPPSPAGPPPTSGAQSPFAPGTPPPTPGAQSPFAPGGPQPGVGVDPQNPYASPGDYAAALAPGMAAAQAEPGHAIIDFGDIYSRTWAIFKPNWGMCLAVMVVVWLISFAVNLAGNFIPIVGPLAAGLFGVWIGIGQALFFLKTARGQNAEMGDIFSGGPYFLNVLLAQILLALIILAILVVCILPCVLVGMLISPEITVALGFTGGIVAAVVCMIVMLMFSQFYFLILDRNMGPIDSLTISKRITHGNKLTLFAIGIVSFLLAFVAILPCGLGLLVAVPYFALMAPVIYLAMTAQPAVDQLQPQQPQI